MNKKRKEGKKESVHGGKSLSNMQLLTKVIQRANIVLIPLLQMHSFIIAYLYL